MSPQYIGNQDYRGYLNYLGSQGNQIAKQLIGSGGSLGIVNNQGQITSGGGVRAANLVQGNDQLYKQYQQSINPSYLAGANILGSGGTNYAATAPNWDINAIYNQAGGQAAANVNPYYTSQLQKFQSDQAAAKAIQQRQNDLNLENLQNTLTNNLQGNETSRGRTSQDVLQNEQQVGIAADQRQQDQGQQFDQARLAQAKQLAGQGLTTSGLGSQQALQSETTRNVQEQRQGAQDQQQVAAQELTKARTFEDLANSDVLANTANAQGKKQASIDWDKFVQGQTSDLTQEQGRLETSRLAQLATTQKQLAQQQLNSMIQAISNPAQRAAAAATYGGRFA